MDYFVKKQTKRKSGKRGKTPVYFLLAVLAAAALLARTPLEQLIDRLYQRTGLHPAAVSTLGEHELRVHFIDVGQGLSILIQTPEQNVLYDAGEVDKEQTVAAYLRAQGVNRLDLVVASHPHTDHIGSLYPLTQTFRAKRVLLPEIPDALLPNHTPWRQLSNAFAYSELTPVTARQGDVYELGSGVKMTILGPPHSDYDGLNLFSVVCRIDYGGDSFLLTGDMEAPNEIELLDTLDKDELRADVLSLGHHGSKTSNTARWLDTVAPDAAVASAGRDNDYGHPHAGVVKRLQKRDITLYNTAVDGSVVFSSFANGIKRLELAQEGEKAAA